MRTRQTKSARKTTECTKGTEGYGEQGRCDVTDKVGEERGEDEDDKKYAREKGRKDEQKTKDKGDI